MKRAANCGGKVFCGLFDVMSHGRMSAIADPTGAVFSIREAKDHPGIGVRNENAAFCWADLSAPDEYIGGIPPAGKQPPYGLLYFQTDDCDASTEKAKEAGANIFMGPMSIENVGRMSVLADPQGAVFALFQK